MNSIRIVSDGRFTRVYDVATGTELSKITRLVVTHEVGSSPHAVVTFIDVESEVEAQVQTAKDRELIEEFASL